jgi:hypothetical protein
MPPTCGFGTSERLFSFLSNKPMRECVIFPLMRPEEGVLLEKAPTMVENRNVVMAKKEENKEGKK